jgi:hypothetical protein
MLVALATVLVAVAGILIAHVDVVWNTGRSKHYGDLSGWIIIAIALVIFAFVLISPHPHPPPHPQPTDNKSGVLPKFKASFDESGNPLPQPGSPTPPPALGQAVVPPEDP